MLVYIILKQVMQGFEHFFKMINSQNVRKDTLLTISLNSCASIEDSVGELSSDLKQLFYRIFTKDQPKEYNLKDILPFKQRKTPMPICNKILNAGIPIFRCYQCTTHEAAVLCITCFQRGNHKGHRFSKIQAGGGNCDCGNPDAIAPQGFCIDHKGTADEMIIGEQEQNQFLLYMKQIFVWILKLYKLQLKKQPQSLLIALINYLDWLNSQSLYYNTLTNKLLFSGENQIIDHILVLGQASRESPLSKKATNLFLKIFSLEVFKENISIAYLRAYNRINNFQTTNFQSLFIQLFANNDLVEKIVSKSGLSLDPRGRDYKAQTYYNSLYFMGSIKQRAALAFFTPIIKNGGVDCQFMDKIQAKCQIQGIPAVRVFSESIHAQNSYYTVNKILIRLMKSDRELFQMEIRNQYKLIKKYSYRNNKIVLINPRIFILLLFVYFQGNIQQIDVEQIGRILSIPKAQLGELFTRLAGLFLCCIKEFAKNTGNNFYRDDFQKYMDLYCRKGNIIVNIDFLGIKICLIALHKINRTQSFVELISTIFDQERRKFLNEQLIQSESSSQGSGDIPVKNTRAQQSALFLLSWANLVNFLIQIILFQKSQVCLGIQMQIKNDLMQQLQQKQFQKLMLNARELSMHQMQTLEIYWFNKISKEVINKYTIFDKAKKKFVLKEEVQGIPIKKQLLKSLTKSPDYYLKSSEQMAMEITNKIRGLREVILPPSLLRKIFKGLIAHLHSSLKSHERYSKDLANQLKTLNILFQNDLQVIDDLVDDLIQQAQSNQKLKAQIMSMFEDDKNVVEQAADKQKNEQRKEMLRKKKEQKLKQIKKKGNIQKFLQPHQLKEQANNVESCIICHESSSQSPLYYMAQTFFSNVLYSVLKVDGMNPFFLSCFHQVHYSCYIELSKQQVKTTCPLCKAYTNILIPTEENVSKPNVLQIVFERIGVVFALGKNKGSQNIQIQLIKSFIQLFFSQTIQNGLINARQIKLFKIILQLIKTYHSKLLQEQKDILYQNLLKVSQNYHKKSQSCYNLGLFIDFIFLLSIKFLKNEPVNQEYLTWLVQDCKLLPKNDIRQCLSLASKLFEINCSLDNLLEFEMQEQGKQLKSYIHTFDPPKTIRSLLQERKIIDSQNICKPSHNICICLLCAWKGCFDCKGCASHTKQAHNEDAVYFNFLTGGFYHQYHQITIKIRSFYLNELGTPWIPSFKEENYDFDIDMYKKMVLALKCGNLIQMISNHYSELAEQNNFGIWSF